MKTALTIARIVVGILFIFSGLIKANDPMGLSYKMQEFFEVWGLQSLNDYTLALSLVMNAFEIVAGVALLVGWQMRMFSWLLLLLIVFFTFLTGYALFSGKIKTCGCFGDCIPLTARQSFIKDLVLLVLIIFIFIFRNTIKPAFRPGLSGVLIGTTVVFCVFIQYYVLVHLPVVDCLAYRKGNNLINEMKTPEGAVPDSFAIKFKYRKDGKEVEFDADHFPDDFNDSTYVYVDRIQELIRPATASAAITDFILYNDNGEDTTLPVLASPGRYVMLFVKNANEAGENWGGYASQVSAYAAERQIPFYVVTATVEAAKKLIAGSRYIKYLKCDATVIKTAARVNPTYFIMKGAAVEGKYANNDYKKVMGQLAQ